MKFIPKFEKLEQKVSLSNIILIKPTLVIIHSYDSGDDPPITQPDLPPTGPSGPGSSS